MISLIWTKNSSIISKLIRFIFQEDVSHFAWLLDDKIVLQSNLLGIHILWFKWFKEGSTIVYRYDLSLPLEKQEALYQEIIKIEPAMWDYKAAFYFGYCGLMHRFFNKPMPKVNAWGNPRAFLCTELAEPLKVIMDIPANFDIMTPKQLYTVVTNGNIPIP